MKSVAAPDADGAADPPAALLALGLLEPEHAAKASPSAAIAAVTRRLVEPMIIENASSAIASIAAYGAIRAFLS
jgi:hypothetical protein